MSIKRWIPVLLLLLLVGGCQKDTGLYLPQDQLADRIETMAREGFDEVPTVSVAGKVSLRTHLAKGAADFLLFYDPKTGLRIDIVDPFFRPILASIEKHGKLWVYNSKTRQMTTGDRKQLFKNLTGMEIPPPAFLPLLMGCIPPGDVVATSSKKCDAQEGETCFVLREKSGRFHSEVEISRQDGSLQAVMLAKPPSEKRVIKAVFYPDVNQKIPRKVKIFDLITGDFVIIKYNDIVTGETLDQEKFNPDQFRSAH